MTAPTVDQGADIGRRASRMAQGMAMPRGRRSANELAALAEHIVTDAVIIATSDTIGVRALPDYVGAMLRAIVAERLEYTV